VMRFSGRQCLRQLTRISSFPTWAVSTLSVDGRPMMECSTSPFRSAQGPGRQSKSAREQCIGKLPQPEILVRVCRGSTRSAVDRLQASLRQG